MISGKIIGTGCLMAITAYMLLYSEVLVTRQQYFPLPEPEQSTWAKEQERRRSILRAACGENSSRGTSRRTKYAHLVEMYKDDLTFLLADDKYKVIYCFIPKVGCTSWKRVFMILGNISDAKQVDDIDLASPHYLMGKMQLLQTTKEDELIVKKLENYKKFIVVRHPIERLASAYFGKIHHKEGILEKQRLLLPFLWKTRKNATVMDITWPEFVSFVVRKRGRSDEHWTPYESLCLPCQIDYDFILKFETLDEDAEGLLRAIGAPDDFHFPHHERRINASLVGQLQKDLTTEQMLAISHYFGNDFDMFEYSIPA
ncbi:carbohydrate sulfotransferase 11-like [Macrobrachium nipponense]|uniref:carbohydrate sulfotransferase 11-like n=1 Tax=Macrobrachium nipponense TaxID=159736 RepID=UPI0030C8C85A